MNTTHKTKDPDAIKPYGVIWCSLGGLNDGSVGDRGFLQGETIIDSTWVVPDGLIEESSNTDPIVIAGKSYTAATVAAIWLSGGTVGQFYVVTNRIVTSGGRTEDQSLYIRVEEN